MAFSLTKLTIFAEIKNLGKNVLLLGFCRVWANGEKMEAWTYTTLWEIRGSFLLMLFYLLMCQINRSTSCTKFPPKECAV